jgi:hypothetical protein
VAIAAIVKRDEIEVTFFSRDSAEHDAQKIHDKAIVLPILTAKKFLDYFLTARKIAFHACRIGLVNRPCVFP